MAIAKINLKESDVNAEINLEELIGPAARNEAVREVFFQAAFDALLTRLDQGKSVDGKNLPKYSKAYKESLDFAAFGKSDTVNMQLTSEMINSLAIKSENPKKFKIGFTEDIHNAKAYAHMTGYEGHPVLAGKVKPRNFFGWQDKELRAIAREIKGSADGADAISDNQVLKLLDRLIG